MYKIDITYYNIDDCSSYTDIYVSEDKKELLKIYLKLKKQYDYVNYKVTKLTESPYHVYWTMEDMW